MPHRTTGRGGGIIIQVIAFASIGVIILSGLVNWAGISLRAAQRAEVSEQALQVAEAGIEYYRWHLAHAPSDFQDGTGTPGPYVHPYYDKNGVRIGEFALTVASPPLGSTIVTITSTGTIDRDPAISRAVRTRLGKPSFARYAALSNSLIQFGGGTEVWGPVHSNNGIAFYGDAMHNLVTSAISKYDDPGHSGGNEWAVHQHSPDDPLPPSSLATITAKFIAGRDISVPAVDFNGISVDLADMKTDAIAAGEGYHGASGAQGYRVVLKTSDVYDLYRVDTLVAQPASCSVAIRYQNPTDTSCTAVAPNALWSVNTSSLITGNIPIPASGIIFLEDNTWVEGTIDGARVTIAAAKIPDTGPRKNIILNTDVRYTNYDGRDVIGLIAQNDIIIGMKSQNTQRVDAALIAQNGRLHRYNYERNGDCGAEYTRSQITFFGMFATNQRYALLTSGTSCPSGAGSSGYSNRDFIYDSNLLYSPPPSFPLTTDNYEIISWEEF